MDRNKRAPLRQHYAGLEQKALDAKRYQDRSAQLNALEKTLVSSINSLIRFMDGKTTKTEVVNQLRSIQTPDVEKVVTKLGQLDKTVLDSRIDLKPLLDVLNGVKEQVSLIPKTHAKLPEQKDSVSVSNLDEIILDTSAVEKAIKELKLNPTIDVKAPIVNVKEPDLNPLKEIMLDVVKAVQKIDIPETPVTDLSSLEKESKAHTKQLEEANKHLQKIVDKPVGGGGGGGGHGTPYQTAEGNASYVVLQDGSVPVALQGFVPEDTPHVDGEMGLPVFGIRSDSDAPTASDGEYTLLKLDEQGRLKVSSKPASYPDITGDITAIQATIGTAVAGGTVSGDVSRSSNVMAFCTGTFSGVNCIFEGSLEDTGETNWFGLQAVRSNANTIETTTGLLSAQPTYGWELSVNALKRVRVRATARTSGTQSWRFVQGTYATEPIPAAQVTATQAVSGTVTATVTPPAPATPYFLNSLATTNGALIITGTSSVHSLYATNEGATPAFLKLYNKATAPTVGTDVPEMTITIPAAVGGIPGVANPFMGFIAFRFALGLGIAITGNAVHTDTTAVAAGQVKVKLSRAT